MKMCRRCLSEKDYLDFHKNKQTKDGYSAYCKACKSLLDKNWIANNPEQIKKRKDRSKKWQIDNPDQYKNSVKKWKENNTERKWILDKKSHLWTHYRMTIEDYQSMLTKQDGKCLICNQHKRLVVDHNHSCCPNKTTCGNCVRGLICVSCNTLVGYIETHKNLLDSANKYIKDFE